MRPLMELNATATDQQLKECHRLTCPNLNLRDFIVEHKDATEVDSLLRLITRQLLQELASRNRDSGHFHCLITSLTCIVTAKPHSADVERQHLQFKSQVIGCRCHPSPSRTIAMYHKTWVTLKLLTLQKQPLIGLEQKPERKRR